MIDYATIAEGTTIAADQELPSNTPTRRAAGPNPFLDLMKAAAKDGKRRDLPGRFSLKPYAGKVSACETFTIVNTLKAAARELGVKILVRKLDATTDDTGLTFKVSK